MIKLTYTSVTNCLVVLLLAITVTSCGWHLRGSGQKVNNISSVHISGVDKKHDFYRALSRTLEASKVIISDSHTEAQYRIVLTNLRSDRRTATVSSSARVSEYQLTELVDVLIFAADGRQVLPRTTMRTERFFDYDENDVQSKSEESKLLKREMTNDLVNKIIRRLNAISNRSNSSASSAPSSTTE